MLLGFVGCAVMKIIGAMGVSLPIYFDSFFIGLLANILGLVIGSALTQVTKEEKEFRDRLFVVPEEELDDSEMKKTKRTIVYFIVFGVIGAVCGAVVSRDMPVTKLRKLFGVFLLFISAYEIYSYFKLYIKGKKRQY